MPNNHSELGRGKNSANNNFFAIVLCDGVDLRRQVKCMGRIHQQAVVAADSSTSNGVNSGKSEYFGWRSFNWTSRCCLAEFVRISIIQGFRWTFVLLTRQLQNKNGYTYGSANVEDSPFIFILVSAPLEDSAKSQTAFTFFAQHIAPNRRYTINTNGAQVAGVTPKAIVNNVFRCQTITEPHKSTENTKPSIVFASQQQQRQHQRHRRLCSTPHCWKMQKVYFDRPVCVCATELTKNIFALGISTRTHFDASCDAHRFVPNSQLSQHSQCTNASSDKITRK